MELSIQTLDTCPNKSGDKILLDNSEKAGLRKASLLSSSDYHSFTGMARDLLAWSSGLRRSLITEEKVSDAASAQMLKTKHDNLKAEIETSEKTFSEVVTLGEAMVEEEHPAHAEVKAKVEAVLTERQKLHTAWHLRDTKLLLATLTAQEIALSNTECGNTIEEVEAHLKAHDAFQNLGLLRFNTSMENTCSAEAWVKEQPDKTEKELENSVCEEDYLFEEGILKDIDLSLGPVTFNPPLTVLEPGDGLCVRPLRCSDYENGFLKLLGQLTTVGEVSREVWEQRFSRMKKMDGTYLVTILEDLHSKEVIGSATLVVENKFIHGCGNVGRVEDVVVSDKYRGRQLGKFLLVLLTQLAKSRGCYKVTLNCADSMISFYTSLGYLCEPGNANFMALRL